MKRPRSERVLVAGHSGRVTHAKTFYAGRNAVPHDALIILTSNIRAPDLSDLVQDAKLDHTRIEVRTVDADDLDDCLEVARDTLAANQQHQITVQVTGGRRILTMALMIASFQHGVRSYYSGPSGTIWLPFPDVAVTARFTSSETHVLRHAHPEHQTPLEDFLKGDHSRDAVFAAIRNLKRNGFVSATPTFLELTAQGRYSRETIIHQKDRNEAPARSAGKQETHKGRRGASSAIRR